MSDFQARSLDHRGEECLSEGCLGVHIVWITSQKDWALACWRAVLWSRMEQAIVRKPMNISGLDGVAISSDAFFPFRDSIDHATRRVPKRQLRRSMLNLSWSCSISSNQHQHQSARANVTSLAGLLLRLGVKYVAQPGGSVADAEVIEACNTYGMAWLPVVEQMSKLWACDRLWQIVTDCDRLWIWLCKVFVLEAGRQWLSPSWDYSTTEFGECRAKWTFIRVSALQGQKAWAAMNDQTNLCLYMFVLLMSKLWMWISSDIYRIYMNLR